MIEQTVLALITCQTYPEPSDNLKTLAAHLETMGVKTVFDCVAKPSVCDVFTAFVRMGLCSGA